MGLSCEFLQWNHTFIIKTISTYFIHDNACRFVVHQNCEIIKLKPHDSIIRDRNKSTEFQHINYIHYSDNFKHAPNNTVNYNLTLENHYVLQLYNKKLVTELKYISSHFSLSETPKVRFFLVQEVKQTSIKIKPPLSLHCSVQ